MSRKSTFQLVEPTTQRTIRVKSNRLKSSRLDHFFYLPCSPSCVIFFLSDLQIDFPVSRTDYTTDDSSRIDSNRVNSTTFSTLPVRLLVWFFQVSRKSTIQLVEPTTQRTIRVESSRIDSNRVDSTTFFTLPVRLLDDSSRIETSCHYLRRIESVWVYWTTLTLTEVSTTWAEVIIRVMMTFAQVAETSVNVTSNSPPQDYNHPDDHNLRNYNIIAVQYMIEHYLRLFEKKVKLKVQYSCIRTGWRRKTISKSSVIWKMKENVTKLQKMRA